MRTLWQLFKASLFCLSVVVGALSLFAPQTLSTLVAAPAHGLSQATESLMRVITGPVASVVDSGNRADAVQCDSLRHSTGSEEFCAVMMTPAELAELDS
jgi:hypothetical protein